MQQIKLDFSFNGQGSITWLELEGWADAKYGHVV